MRSINSTKCHHFEDCGNMSLYEFETVDGNTITVCPECDEIYGQCGICLKSGILDGNYGDNSLVDGYCDEPTCFYCLEKRRLANREDRVGSWRLK